MMLKNLLLRIEAHERMTKANKNQTVKYVTIWNSDWSKMKCLPSEKFSIQGITAKKINRII